MEQCVEYRRYSNEKAYAPKTTSIPYLVGFIVLTMTDQYNVARYPRLSNVSRSLTILFLDARRGQLSTVPVVIPQRVLHLWLPKLSFRKMAVIVSLSIGPHTGSEYRDRLGTARGRVSGWRIMCFLFEDRLGIAERHPIGLRNQSSSHRQAAFRCYSPKRGHGTCRWIDRFLQQARTRWSTMLK